MLFSTVYAPSEEALHDAGEMTNRERVPIHWALPLEGRTGPGVLWAFFPTEYETTLSGIVNAPWKTTSERRNLLEGVFNEELLSVVAQLVVNNLDALTTCRRPGPATRHHSGPRSRGPELGRPCPDGRRLRARGEGRLAPGP